MSYIQNYQDHSPLTDQEIQTVVGYSQMSVFKTINRPDGKKDYILSTKALLNANGKPIPIDEFMIKSGQRIMLTPVVKEVIAPEAKQRVKKEVSQWKKDNPNHKYTPVSKSLRNLKFLLETSAMIN